MSSRPSDDLQPTSKRRPGQQLTKDDPEEDDDGDVDPGSWTAGAKASDATLARRKIIRVRRGGAPAAVGEEAATVNAPAANPFAGIVLAGAGAPASTASAAGAPAPAAAAEQGEEAPVAEPAAAPEQPTVGDATPAAEVAENGGVEEGAASDKPTAATAPEALPAAAEPEAAPPAATAAAPVFGSGAGGGFGGWGANGGAGFGGFGGGFGGLASASGAGAPTSGFGAGAGGGFGAGGTSLFAAAPMTASASMFGLAARGEGDAQGDAGGEGDAGGDAGGTVEGVFGAETAPVVTLEEVPKRTGEEGETLLFAADGVLYEFVDANWRERGRGEFRINQDLAAGTARMVMRVKSVARLVLNARLYPGMATAVMMGGKGVTFAVRNAAGAADGAGGSQDAGAEGGGEGGGGGGAMRTYALKMKSPALVDQFARVVEAHRGGSGEAAAEGDASDRV